MVEVPIKKLDSFLEEKSLKKLDFMRMDVEGYEFNIYEGIRNSIKKFKFITLIVRFLNYEKYIQF